MSSAETLTSSFSSFSFSQSSSSSSLSTSTSQAAPPSSSLLFSTQACVPLTSNTARLLAQQTPSSPLNPSPRTVLPSLPSVNSSGSLSSSTGTPSGGGSWASAYAPNALGRSPARPSLLSSPSARSLSSPYRPGGALPRSASLSSSRSSFVGAVASAGQSSFSLNDRDDAPSLDFSPAPLGSAALYSPEDAAVEASSVVQSTAKMQKEQLGSGVSWMGSPFSETSEIVITPPGTPSRGSKALNTPDQLVLSADSIKRNFSNDAIMLALANRVAQLDALLASVSTECATLRNENRHLKMTTFSAPEASSPSMSDRRSSNASSTALPAPAEDVKDSPHLTSSTFSSKIVPSLQPYESGSLPLPPASIVKSYTCSYPSTDFRSLLSSSHALPTFQARAEWCCAILAGAHVEQYDGDSQVLVKDGPLRKMRDALSDILHLERRSSPRVCLLLDIILTASVLLATRSQGNYLIQSSLSLGLDVRTALWSRIRPRFVEIANSDGGYGTHVLVQLMKTKDLRDQFMDELLKVTDDVFLGSRGGMRVVEAVFKSMTPKDASALTSHVSEILSGKWLSYATSQYGCILVQGLLEIYDQYKSFCDPFLQEINPHLPTLIASQHGSFVFQKLTHPQSPLRTPTLLALLLTPTSDPLIAGPAIAKEALLAAAASTNPPLDMDEIWESWEARVCDGEFPPIVLLCHKPCAWNLLSHVFSSAPPSLSNRIRRILLASSAYVRSHPPGSEIISAILASSPLSHSALALPPLPSSSSASSSYGQDYRQSTSYQGSPQKQQQQQYLSPVPHHAHLPPGRGGFSRSNSYSGIAAPDWARAAAEPSFTPTRGSVSRSASFSGVPVPSPAPPASSASSANGNGGGSIPMGGAGVSSSSSLSATSMSTMVPRSWSQAASGAGGGAYGSIGRGPSPVAGGGGPSFADTGRMGLGAVPGSGDVQRTGSWNPHDYFSRPQH